MWMYHIGMSENFGLEIRDQEMTKKIEKGRKLYVKFEYLKLAITICLRVKRDFSRTRRRVVKIVFPSSKRESKLVQLERIQMHGVDLERRSTLHSMPRSVRRHKTLS